MPSWLLSAQHITRRFLGVAALQDVSVQVAPGEVHALRLAPLPSFRAIPTLRSRSCLLKFVLIDGRSLTGVNNFMLTLARLARNHRSSYGFHLTSRSHPLIPSNLP
jgi:hypothetical protein